MPFLNPAVLGGLGLIGVPIAIHLLNRRRFRVVRWAAMDLLLAADKRNRRRLRLEHLLLLLLRCLAVALIVLAVARPVTTAGVGLLLPGASDPLERVVVLDDSASMAYRSGRASSYERALDLLRGLNDGLRRERPGDLLTVYTASDPRPRRASSPERAEELLRQLSEAGPGMGTWSVPDVLARVCAPEEGGDAPRQKVVYVLTDLKARDWVGADGALPRAVAEALRRAPEGTRFLVVDVGSSEEKNLSLVSLWPVEKLALVGVPLELRVEVANRGREPVYDVPLFLEAGEARVPLPSLTRIDPGATVEVRHRYTFSRPGPQTLNVRPAEDALPADDSRALALGVSETLKVLLVDGEEGAGPLQDETDLLRLALSPAGDVLTGVDPVVVGAQALSQEDLSGYDSVVVCNLDRWPAARRAELERYVERGGGLAVFLGDRVDPDAWNRELYRGGAGPLPCALGGRQESPSLDDAPGVSPPEQEHPLVQVFLGERNPFLKRVRGRIRRSLTLPDDERSRVVLRFADPEGTPFVVERPFGRGRTVLFNTSADLAWGTWPRDPSFPVTAQELVRLLAPPSTAGRNLAVGEPLERSLAPAVYLPQARLRVPGEDAPRELHAEPRPGSDLLWVSFAATRRAGVYGLELSPRQGVPGPAEPFAVNVDPGEGETAPADPAQLLPWMEGLSIRFVRPEGEEALLRLSDGTRTELWRTVLYALLLCLGLEQLLAWRAAHHQGDLAGEASS